MNDARRIRFLFLCAGNSCRCQMAEALARTIGHGFVECSSAGQDGAPVHPLAIEVMAEIGIDITGQKSRTMEQLLGERFDHVITLREREEKVYPVWPNADVQGAWSIEDPLKATGTDAERRAAFRRVRDDLRRRMELALLANKIPSVR